MKKATLDLSALTEDQLVELARFLAAELRRRGATVEAAAKAAVSEEEGRDRIARAAARRQAEDEAAARADREQAAVLRAIAREARALFGSDVPEFTVAFWEKPGDQRIYIGKGYDKNWVEYYHDGNARVSPGTLTAIGDVTDPLATYLGCTAQEAREEIRAFCRSLIEEKGFRGRLEVTPENAPLDPEAVTRRYRLKWTRADGMPCWAGNESASHQGNRYVISARMAQVWPTEAAARAAIPEYACGLLADQSAIEVEAVIRPAPFPPRPESAAAAAAGVAR